MEKQSKVVIFDQRTDWVKGRGRSIGSSDAAVILGIGYAGSSRYKLWQQKTGRDREEFSEAQQKQFSKGHAAEPYLANLLKIDHGWDVQFDPPNSFRRSIKYPYLTASLDAWMEVEGELVVLEFKNVGAYLSREWDVAEGKAPLKYTVQIQHQMLVTGARYGYLVALIGFEVKLIRVDRDDEFLEVLLKEYADFWSYVEKDTEPPPDDTVETFEALCRDRQVNEMEVLHLDAADSEFVESIFDIDQQIESLTKKRQAAMNRLVQRAGHAEYLVTTGGRWFSFKSRGKSTKRVLKPHKGKVF